MHSISYTILKGKYHLFVQARVEGVRQIRDGIVSTVCRCEGYVRGLILDESEGLLYATVGDRIITVVVGTAQQQYHKRVDPVMRTWCLAQRRRAELLPAPADIDARAARERETLRLLMRCPIVEVTYRVCNFAF